MKEIQKLFPWKIIMIILVTAFSGCIKNNIPDQPHAAESFIKLGNGIIVVKDVWSKKLSLPGGVQKKNESLEETARRKTLEETGILVTVGKELMRTPDYVLFQCEPVNIVSAIKMQFPKGKLFYRIPHLNASRNEIERILLINPMLSKEKDFRFPSQLKIIQKLFAEEEKISSNLLILEKPLRCMNKIEYLGTRIISGFQKFDAKIIKIFSHIFSSLGSQFIFLAVPYFLLCTPGKQGKELLFLILVSSLINFILKGTFGLPRPFEILPSIQLSKGIGFGFPSGHAQLATVFWGYFFWRARSDWIKLILITIILLVGLSRIYLGVHYPHDVVGGWFFGAIIVSVYYILASRKAVHSFSIGQSFSWGIFVCVAFLSIRLWFHPVTVGIIALWYGVLCGIVFSGKRIYSKPLSFGFGQKVIRTLIGILGMIFILVIFHFITPEDKKFFTMFVIQVLKYFCLGLWLCWGSFVIVDTLKK
ncbi:MAG: phosphatase PAP2 family protein [Candidatus Scalindua sp.]|nr:phosphatase PAP2 family protein [Candidatus Scalindua sp.]